MRARTLGEIAVFRTGKNCKARGIILYILYILCQNVQSVFFRAGRGGNRGKVRIVFFRHILRRKRRVFKRGLAQVMRLEKRTALRQCLRMADDLGDILQPRAACGKQIV